MRATAGGRSTPLWVSILHTPGSTGVLPPPARNKGPYPKVTARSPGSALRTQDRSRQARVHSRTSDLGARYPSPPEVGHATPYRPTDSVHSNVAVVAGSVALSDSPSRRPPPAAALRPPRPLPRPLLPCPAGPALRFPGGGSRAGRVCPGGGPVRVRGGSCVGARSWPRSLWTKKLGIGDRAV